MTTPTTLLPPPQPQVTPQKSRQRLPVWAWVLICLVGALLTLILSPFLAPLFLVVLITGTVAMAKNTPTWLRFRNRKVATAVTAISTVAFMITGTISANVFGQGMDHLPSAAPAATESATPAPVPTIPADQDEDADADDELIAFTGDVSTVSDSAATSDLAALDVLETIPVKGRAAKTGYDRAEFGQRWLDVDRNGCDTRNDILGAQLSDVVRKGSCRVLTGTLDDPYTGMVIDFVRGQGTSELVQIDHVVALSDAWQKGAQLLTADQRATFANDPLNLLAVDGSANAQKRDGDAATWLPKNTSFRCEYVARQVAVKATYGLWVTQAEHDAIRRILTTCPAEPTPTSAFAAVAAPVTQPPVEQTPAPVRTSSAPVPFAPAPAPVVPAKPAPVAPKPAKPAPVAPKPAPKPAKPAPVAPKPPVDVTYRNCTDARAHGAAPIYKGEPGYSRKLDRDGDGIACE